MEAYDYVIKIIFIGAASVGKTSLLCNYCNKHYDAKYCPTIGVDFHATYHRMDEKTIKCHMWDTAGQERYKSIVNSYYKGVSATVCLFDVSRPRTFDSAKEWIDTVKQASSTEYLPVLVVANKVDLDHSKCLIAEAKNYCNENGYHFIETSAKKSIGISDAIESIVQKVYDEIIVAGVLSPSIRTIDHEKQVKRLSNSNYSAGSYQMNCC